MVLVNFATLRPSARSTDPPLFCDFASDFFAFARRALRGGAPLPFLNAIFISAERNDPDAVQI